MLRVNAINRQELLKCLTFNPKSLVFKTVSVPLNATSSWGGTRKLPYAFTREGIGMLSSVLGSDTAIEMNIRIMRVFTAAHQIMENNALLFQKVLHIERHQLETDGNTSNGSGSIEVKWGKGASQA